MMMLMAVLFVTAKTGNAHQKQHVKTIFCVLTQ